MSLLDKDQLAYLFSYNKNLNKAMQDSYNESIMQYFTVADTELLWICVSDIITNHNLDN